jgi:hypothetical protein
MIITFASQGAIPGVMMCVEPAGNVEFEALADNCCFRDTKPADRSAVFLRTTSLASESASSCGPCTDSPISPAPVTKPAENGDVCVGLLVSSSFSLDPASIETEIFSVSSYVANDAALIPIKTTALLI